jgi:hypothetical protein
MKNGIKQGRRVRFGILETGMAGVVSREIDTVYESLGQTLSCLFAVNNPFFIVLWIIEVIRS